MKLISKYGNEIVFAKNEKRIETLKEQGFTVEPDNLSKKQTSKNTKTTNNNENKPRQALNKSISMKGTGVNGRNKT